MTAPVAMSSVATATSCRGRVTIQADARASLCHALPSIAVPFDEELASPPGLVLFETRNILGGWAHPRRLSKVRSSSAPTSYPNVFQSRQGRALAGLYYPGVADDVSGDYIGQPPHPAVHGALPRRGTLITWHPRDDSVPRPESVTLRDFGKAKSPKGVGEV